jgi:uncharacterized protein with ParB-like and HNH nuclease domain
MADNMPEIEPEEEEKDVIKLDRYDISVNLIQPTLETWISNIDNEDILIPPFQRNFRWKIERASKLIESFILGLPVPPIFLYEDFRKQNRLVVIDGQQRLLSVYFYFKQKFPRSGIQIFNEDKSIVRSIEMLEEKAFAPFELINVDDRWEGSTYGILDEGDKNWLKRRPLWAITVRQIKPDAEKLNSIFYIFERLNTGGEPLTPMEIRKALHFGKFYKLLERLNKYPNWRKLYGHEAENEKLLDIELILRFFSLQNWEKYKEPMKEFLNNFMHENCEVGDEKLEELENLFCKTCDLITQELGRKPFHIKGPLSTATMDSFMVGTSQNILKLSPGKLSMAFKEAMADEEYILTLESRVNVKEKVLKKRLGKVSEIFEKVIREEE